MEQQKMALKKNMRQQYENSKLRIVGPTWNDVFELSDGSYSVSDIQDYIGYIIKKQDTLLTNLSTPIHINRINSRLLFKIKDGYKLELQTYETLSMINQM